MGEKIIFNDSMNTETVKLKILKNIFLEIFKDFPIKSRISVDYSAWISSSLRSDNFLSRRGNQTRYIILKSLRYLQTYAGLITLNKIVLLMKLSCNHEILTDTC